MEKLTHQEEAIMQIIWQTGKGFIKDYIEKLPDPKPPYTTIASIAKKLEDKGYIQGKKYGVIIEYSIMISEKEYKKKFMKGFVKDYFENSYKELVTFFAKDNKISPEDLKEIIKMIEEEK
ncbi:MAG: BlaI/MecI/CopY family transcriptional regulator [Chitinophagaceae bacterium]